MFCSSSLFFLEPLPHRSSCVLLPSSSGRTLGSSSSFRTRGMFCSPPPRALAMASATIRFAFSCFFWCSSHGFPQFLSCPSMGSRTAGEDRAATSLALRTLTTESPEEAPLEEPAYRNKDTTISTCLWLNDLNKQP